MLVSTSEDTTVKVLKWTITTLNQGDLSRYIAEGDTAWGYVWSLESWSFAHILNKELGIFWMCSCDLVGYNLPREVLNTSSWKEIMNVRSGTDILKVCNVCARTTVTIESYQWIGPTNELITVWMISCDLDKYNCSRQALNVSSW